MTRLMDLLFFDKGRIDKKNQIQCTRALRPISLPLFAAPPPLYAAPPPLYELPPPPSAAPRLLIDFTMHYSQRMYLPKYNMISVKSVGLMIVGNQLLSLQSLKRTILLLNIKSLNISRAVSYCYETEFEIRVLKISAIC